MTYVADWFPLIALTIALTHPVNTPSPFRLGITSPDLVIFYPISGIDITFLTKG